MAVISTDLQTLEVFDYPGMGARDFSSAVSGFCQVFIVTSSASANTENSLRTRKKPPVPRVVFDIFFTRKWKMFGILDYNKWSRMGGGSLREGLNWVNRYS